MGKSFPHSSGPQSYLWGRFPLESTLSSSVPSRHLLGAVAVYYRYRRVLPPMRYHASMYSPNYHSDRFLSVVFYATRLGRMLAGCVIDVVHHLKTTILSFTGFKCRQTTGRVGCEGGYVGINGFGYRGQCDCPGALTKKEIMRYRTRLGHAVRCHRHAWIRES